MSGVMCPTYKSGFYSPSRGGRARYPQLWRGCVGAYAPCLGQSGLMLMDNSGRGHHGTLTNMDASTDWVVSGGTHAINYDGSNDYVTMTAPPQSSALSVSIWVRYMLSANFDDCISAADSSIGSNGHWCIGTVSGATLAFNIRVPTTGLVSVTDSAAVTVNAWNHIVATYSGSAAEFWRDGVRRNYSALNSGTMNTLGTVMLGTRTAAGNFFNGEIADVILWNRALSVPEIRLLASRRGIAYELDRRPRAKAAAVAPSTRRRQMLHCL